MIRFIKITLTILISIFIFYPVGYFILPDEDKNIHFDKTKKVEGIMCYIINLDRSKDRYEHIEPQVKSLGLPYKRISAVDGSKISDTELLKKVDFKSYQQFLGSPPKKGTIGCSLSHINVWNDFLNSSYEYALIFEDDVIFNPQDLLNAVHEVTKKKNIWDICSFELWHRGMPLALDTLNSQHHLALYLFHVTHTGCYIVSRHAANQLLKKVSPIKIPIDHYFTRGWEFNLKFVGVEPRIVKQISQDPADSVIESGPQCNTEEEIKYHLHKLFYTLQTHIIYFLHNITFYIKYKLGIL